MAYIKSAIKNILPKQFMSWYYFSLAYIANLYYGHPSDKVIVIGITGTKGKTTTANFIWACLAAAGYKTGLITTANIKIGERELLNKYHMTMPGRFKLQGLIDDMVKNGCKYCVVETTSEGIKQFRHIGINYDVVVFTNLFKEHLASHDGSFEKYKQVKGTIFAGLKHGRKKIFNGKIMNKVIIANNDSPEKNYFLGFWADKKLTFGLSRESDYYAFNIKEESGGLNFFVNDYQKYKINIEGRFNAQNALAAIVVAKTLGVSETDIKRGLENLLTIPGRMEKIDEGQNFSVYVDYAHQKESMEELLKSAVSMVEGTNGKIILLLGAEGGGRDKTKRKDMGELAGSMANYVIVSNVDPYDDDPAEIIDDIAKAVLACGKQIDKNLFLIEDRAEGIQKALSLAKKGDVVLITGKGSEQSMIIGNKKIAWDDREIVRSKIRKTENAKRK